MRRGSVNALCTGFAALCAQRHQRVSPFCTRYGVGAMDAAAVLPIFLRLR
jgi:TPP-dependent 2-oxoacid decarboxylase